VVYRQHRDARHHAVKGFRSDERQMNAKSRKQKAENLSHPLNLSRGARRPIVRMGNVHPKSFLERTVFSKFRTSMFALAAIAAVGAASLMTTTSAEARGFGGGGFRAGGGAHFSARMAGPRMGMRHVGGPRFVGRVGPRFVVNRPHVRPNWCRWTGRCHIHVRWHRPWLYTAPVAAVATTYAIPAAVAAAPRCTCLTKEYTQDGLVVFKDVCTKEVASAPQGNTQVQLQLPQQQDQQQGPQQ
jgi:hypothetical protein